MGGRCAENVQMNQDKVSLHAGGESELAGNLNNILGAN